MELISKLSGLLKAITYSIIRVMVSSILKYAYDNVFVSFKEICHRNQSVLMEISCRGLVFLLLLFQYFLACFFCLYFIKMKNNVLQ
jgi:hypothetical protein